MLRKYKRLPGYEEFVGTIWLLFAVFLMAPTFALATPLSDLAASMQPGTWAVLPTSNINPVLRSTGGASGFIFGFANAIGWDPVSKQLFYVGSDHNQSVNEYLANGTPCGARFIKYQDSNNTWVNLPRENWMATNCSGAIHGYDWQTVDPSARYFLHWQNETIYRYHIDRQVWDGSKKDDARTYYSYGGVGYFPEMGGVFHAMVENGIMGGFTKYTGYSQNNNGTWSRIGPFNTIPFDYLGLVEYNPVHKVMLVVGGGQTPHTAYKVDAQGNFTTLSTEAQNTFPVNVAVKDDSAIVTVDPVSGDYLIFVDTDPTGWYVFNIQTNTWTRKNEVPPIYRSGHPHPVFGTVATPVDTYGVTLFVECQQASGNCQVHLYKHASGSVTPPPPSDTTTPSVPTNSTATALSASQINFSWNAATDNVAVTGYRIYRNGTQIASANTTAYQDTGLSPSTTYSYAAAAYDAAGNISAQSAIVSATTFSSPPPPSSSDFLTRCSQPGVVRCFDFDDAVTTAKYFLPSGEAVPPMVDTSMKTSGAGSLKFTIPTNYTGQYGAFGMNFTPGSLNCSADFAACLTQPYGTQFGSGETFYVQWRQRFSSQFLAHVQANGGGWKQVIIGEGDRTQTQIYTCTGLEIVTQNTANRGVPQMYHSCGGKDQQYQPIYEGLAPYDFKIQNAPPSPYCLYSKLNKGDRSGCVEYYPNEWMTFQVKIHIGTWYLNDHNYHRDSQIQLWVAREGQPSTLVLDTGLFQTNTSVDPGVFQQNSNGGYDIANDSGNPAVKYGKLWLLPYNTGANGVQTQPGYTWYDELIISRSKIPDPSYSTASNPPAAPTGLSLK